MDMSCPSCHVLLSPKEAARRHYLRREYCCQHCQSNVVKTEDYFESFSADFFKMLIFVAGFEGAWLIGHHFQSFTASLVPIIIFGTIFSGLIYWITQHRIKTSPNPYWKLKDAPAKQ